jgi:cytochrome c-type biogenesis protein CcmF
LDLFGSFALLLAFACALYAIVAGIIAIRTRNPLIQKSARHAGIAVCILVMIGTISLFYLFLTDDFSVSYVAGHSNRNLESFFKVP